MSEESAEYLCLSCTTVRTIVAHGMWPLLAGIVQVTTPL